MCITPVQAYLGACCSDNLLCVWWLLTETTWSEGMMHIPDHQSLLHVMSLTLPLMCNGMLVQVFHSKHELKGALNNEDISSSFVELDVPSRDVLVRTVTAEPFSMLGLVLQPRQSLLRTLLSDSLQR